MVGAAHAFTLPRQPLIEHQIGDAAQLHIGQRLGVADGDLRPREQLVAKGIARAVERLTGQAMVDKADVSRPLRAQQFAGQQKFLGAGQADPLRPEDRAAIPRDQPDADMRIADLGLVVREYHIAEQRNRRAQTHRMAVEAAHHHLVDGEQSQDDALGNLHLMVEQMRVRRAMRDMVEVAARAERPARTGQHDHIRRRIRLGELQRGDHLVMHREIEGIEAVWPVERDGQQTPATGEGDGVEVGQVGHARLLSRQSDMPTPHGR